jgi:hypothetical protein
MLTKFVNIQCGLFSNFNMVMTGIWAFHKAHPDTDISYHVDWSQTSQWFHYGPDNFNVWTVLFEPSDTVSPVPLPSTSASEECETKPYDHVITEYVTEGWKLTSTNARTAYLTEPEVWRAEIHDLFTQHIKVKAGILKEVDEFVEAHFKDAHVIAVHMRASIISREQGNGCYPNHDEFANAIDEIIQANNSDITTGKPCKVFLATDNQEAVDYMKARFPDDMFITRDHKLYRANEDHDALGMDTQHARDAFIDALLLSRADHFVHAVSNVATAVLYMNPGLANKFL